MRDYYAIGNFYYLRQNAKTKANDIADWHEKANSSYAVQAKEWNKYFLATFNKKDSLGDHDIEYEHN